MKGFLVGDPEKYLSYFHSWKEQRDMHLHLLICVTILGWN